MNDLKGIDKKALSEICVILDHTDKSVLKKIPKKFISFVEKNVDPNYVVDIDFRKENWEQDVREETKVLLALVYNNYIQKGQ